MKKKIMLWEGTPSQLINFDAFLFWTLFLITIVFFSTWNNVGWLDILSRVPQSILNMTVSVLCLIPVFNILISYLQVKNTNYQLTEERLITAKGILNREYNEMELYRVKDYQISSPFFLRLFSLGTIVLDTSDKSHPLISINAVKNPEAIRDLIRTQVEVLRTAKGVREIDH